MTQAMKLLTFSIIIYVLALGSFEVLHGQQPLDHWETKILYCSNFTSSETCAKEIGGLWEIKAVDEGRIYLQRRK